MINGGSTVFKTKPVCYRCGRPGLIQDHCNYNQSNEAKVFKERDGSYIVLPNQLTVNQKEIPPTKKKMNWILRRPHYNSKVRNTPQTAQIYHKGRRRHGQVTKVVTPRKPNQRPRKLRIQNQLRRVQLPLVNKTDKYPTNLTSTGKIPGKSVHLMVDTGEHVSAMKEVPKEV